MTVYSALESRVCCTPQPAKGSLRFARAASPSHPKAARLVGVRSPQRGSHPSKISPRQQPYRITAAVAFLPLPSCPARVPTEAGVLADRRVPKRATYTRSSLPRRAGPSCPEGRGSGSGPSCPEGRGVRNPPWAQLGRGATPGAPRGAACRAPVRPGARRPEGCRLPGPESGGPLGSGARGSEEPRVPGPGEARLIRPGWNGAPHLRGGSVSLSRWGGVPTAPRGRWFPVPVELACRFAEARRLPGPGGTGWPMLRRAPVARSRWNWLAGAPKSAGCPVPVETGLPVCRSAPVARFRWGWLVGLPKRADCPVPAERGRPCSEERGVPCPCEVRRAVPRGTPLPTPVGRGPAPIEVGGLWPVETGAPALRRGSMSLSRWNGGARAPKSSGFPVPVRPGARCAEALRLPDPGEVRRAMLRRAPCASPRVEPSRSASEEAARPCPGWNWLGDAPRRAACPAPRNRLAGAPRRAVCPAPLAGSPCPDGRGDGCARKRFQCGDAPIRRSGPPRHRAPCAPGCRSPRVCRVKLPCDAGAEAPSPRGATRPPRALT
jgi:hypothetical protein